MKTLYRASRVHTFGHPPTGEWLLIDGRHVQRVGSGEPPAANRTVELPGITILPGFIDTHVHLTAAGLSMSNEDVVAARSKGELLALAAGRSAGDDEPVILLQGFDETRWDRPDHPTLGEMDAVTGKPLVIRRVDGHVALANSAALTFAQVHDAEGFERDGGGNPTGRVTRSANVGLGRWLAESRSEHRIEELQLAAAGLAASAGITSLHEMSMPLEDGERDAEVFRRHREKLPVHAIAIVATMDVPRAIELGPYADLDATGVTNYDDDELAGFFHDAHMAGLQAGIHAIGDRAIEQVLSSWERIYSSLDSRERRHFRARRHRVEHFEMPTAHQVERAAMLGLAVSVQPAFDRAWGAAGGLYAIRVGPERAAAMNPFRTMLERGVVLGAGSDAPVTPLDPWLAVAAMETHHDPGQRLERAAAIRVHTVGSARLVHQEEKKGLLEVDPLEQDEIEGLRPVLTVSLGREVYAR